MAIETIFAHVSCSDLEASIGWSGPFERDERPKGWIGHHIAQGSIAYAGGGAAGVSPWRRMISIILALSGGPPAAA